MVRPRMRPLVLGVLLTACGTARPFVWVGDLPASEEARRIEPGDSIGVAVKGQDDMSGTFTVLENGTYLQPLVGPVSLAGATEAEAATRLANRLRGIVVDAKVTVTVITPRPVRVAVVGEVRTPSQFTVAFDESVLSVIARAGGLTPFANRDGIYVVRKRPRISRVRFRYEALRAGDPASTLFRLHDGDVVVVE